MRSVPDRLPPGPRDPSIVQFLRWLRNPLAAMERYRRDLGDVFTVRLPAAPPFVFFSDPAAIKEIFTGDPDDLRAGEANVLLKSVLGEHSLLLLDGARHLRERRLMMPPFHGERMRTYGETMRDTTLRAMSAWPPGRPFAIHREVQAITLDVILKTVFGLVDEQRLDRMRRAIVHWTDMGSSKLGTGLLLLVPAQHAPLMRRIAEARLDLGPLHLDLGRLAPWRRLNAAHRRVEAVLREEIADRRRSGTAGRADVLSMLIDARDEHGQPMTDDELHDEMVTLLIAGHETSATTLAWAIHHLLDHPLWMERVRSEIAGITTDGRVAPDQAANLPALDAAIKETLRIMPIVPIVARRLGRPMRIGGRDLPAGTVAVAAIHLTHRRPELWPDPGRYDPSRFIGRKIDPYQYYPFGGGTRRCLGMAFASYEMKVVLATILSRVSLGRAPGARVEIVRRGITLAPSGGMPVVATPA